MTPWPPGVFVVGTDTGVGKTRVAAAIARTWMQLGRRVGVLKPVSSGETRVDGALRSDDVAALAAAISTAGSPFPPPPLDRVGPLVFEAPLAPPVAAWVAGVTLDPAGVVAATESALDWWADAAGAELMVVEGVGGLLCPLARPGWTVADLAIHLDYPLLIVAHRGLGTLNHTLLTVEAARARGLRVAGIILNGARPPDDPAAEGTNAAALASFLPDPPVAILADWEHAPDQPFVPVAPEAGHWLDLAEAPRRAGGATAASPPTPAPAAWPTVTSSDDDLLAVPDAAGLLASSSADSTPAAAGPAADAAGFDLGIDPTTPSAGRRATPVAAADEHDRAAGGATSRRGVLLSSYASAVTLALGWTLYQQRAARRSPTPAEPTPPAAERFGEQGRLGGRSRRISPPAPIPDDRLIPLGRAKEVGSLRIEPRSIARRDLVLERLNLVGKAERRPGPKRSLILVVRLSNLTTDQVFAPIDPAFVRVRPDDVAETFLALDDGRKVYPNPLAVDSEWTAAGESFADLRPGESRDVTFATDADAPADAERGPGTWRIKLRTGVDSTAEVGVRLPGGAAP